MTWKKEVQLRRGPAWIQVFKQIFACSFIIMHISLGIHIWILTLEWKRLKYSTKFLIYICFVHNFDCINIKLTINNSLIKVEHIFSICCSLVITVINDCITFLILSPKSRLNTHPKTKYSFTGGNIQKVKS
jgi:hypothetical protein